MAHINKGLNLSIQITAGSSEATVDVRFKDSADLLGTYRIAPQTTKHFCKCFVFVNEHNFHELRELEFTRPGPSVFYSREYLVTGDGRMAIPQQLALDHTYIPDEAVEGVEYANAEPPTLRALAKAVVRGYRLDCHLQPDSLPVSLREELHKIDEQHCELELQYRDTMECPCAGNR